MSVFSEVVSKSLGSDTESIVKVQRERNCYEFDRIAYVDSWLDKQLSVKNLGFESLRKVRNKACYFRLIHYHFKKQKTRPSSKKTALKMLGLDGVCDNQLKEAFTRFLEKDEMLNISTIFWEEYMRSGAYVFKAISGKDGCERLVRGFLFDSNENRGRGKLVTKVLMVNSAYAQLPNLLISTPCQIEFPEKTDKTKDNGSALLLKHLVLVEDKGISLVEFMITQMPAFGVDRALKSIFKQIFKVLYLLHTSHHIQGDFSPNCINITTMTPPGETRPKLIATIVDLSELTLYGSRTYEAEPFGYKKKLHIPGQAQNLYTQEDEVRFAASFFSFIRNYASNNRGWMEHIRPAVSAVEKQALMNGERVSGHFSNMMRSFEINIKKERNFPSPPLNIKNALKHCLFFENEQYISLICSLNSYSTTLLNKTEYEQLKTEFRKRTYSIYTEKKPSSTTFRKPGIEGRADWLDRLGDQVKSFVLSNIKLLEIKGEKSGLTEEESIASNRGYAYTRYNTNEPLHLYVLIRHLWIHLEELAATIRYELGCGRGRDLDKFLSYFTIRCPGLILTLFEIMSELGIPPVPKLTLKHLETSGDGCAIVESEYVTAAEVFIEKRRGNTRDFF